MSAPQGIDVPPFRTLPDLALCISFVWLFICLAFISFNKLVNISVSPDSVNCYSKLNKPIREGVVGTSDLYQ